MHSVEVAELNLTNSQEQTVQPTSIANYFGINESSSNVLDSFALTDNGTGLKNPQQPHEVPSESHFSSLESLAQLQARVSTIVNNDESLSSPAASNSDPIIKELELRNQELAAALGNEKLRNDEQSIAIRDLNSKIDKLNIDIERLKLENSTKLTMEVGPLQEQLNQHIQTIGVLVGEKAELQAYLKEYQNAVQEKRTENEELQSRLRASRFRVGELERELKALSDAKSTTNNANANLSNYIHEIEQLKQKNTELNEEVSELKQKFNLKTTELSDLRTKFDQKTADLNMAQLRIEQLSAGDTLQSDSRLESLTQQNLAKDLQVQEMQKIIEQLGTERDQSNAQYQSYVLQLNRELSSLGEKVVNLTEDNDRLAKRETSLLQHVEQLEKQIQAQQKQQKQAIETNELSQYTEKIENLEKELTEMKEKLDLKTAEFEKTLAHLETQTKERATLKSQLDEKLDAITSMELTVERLQSDKPDLGNLIADLESQKVAASRAVSQNTDLKNQLQEMQTAFVQIVSINFIHSLILKC